MLAALRDLEGTVVSRVTYFLPVPLKDEVWAYPSFDVIPGAVLLQASPCDLYILWRMDDDLGEGLELIIGDGYREHVIDEGLEPALPSGSRYSAVINHPVTAVRAAWQTGPGGFDAANVWAIRLESASGGVSFALGTVGDTDPNEPSYQPDSIVAIFDSGVARGYQPHVARSPATGERA